MRRSLRTTRQLLRSLSLLRVYLNLASLLQQKGEEEAAIEYQYRGLTLQPTWGTFQQYFDLGGTLQKQQKLERAAVCYHRALELDSELCSGLLSLGAGTKQ